MKVFILYLFFVLVIKLVVFLKVFLEFYWFVLLFNLFFSVDIKYVYVFFFYIVIS